MLSNLSLSLGAALALSTAFGVARAAGSPTTPTHGTLRLNDEINALETGNPHSVDYRNRVIPSHSPTNDEINALETGNPDSVDYPNRAIPRHSPTNDENQRSRDEEPAQRRQQQRPAGYPDGFEIARRGVMSPATRALWSIQTG